MRRLAKGSSLLDSIFGANMWKLMERKGRKVQGAGERKEGEALRSELRACVLERKGDLVLRVI